MITRMIARSVAALALLGGVAACSADDAANKALKDAGVNVNTQGGLPKGFPTDVPTPDLKIETGVAVAKGFTLRLTSPSAVADVAAYKDTLSKAGFTMSDEFDNSAKDGHNVGFTATGKGFRVIAVAFTPEAPGGGKYMGVQVDPAT